MNREKILDFFETAASVVIWTVAVLLVFCFAAYIMAKPVIQISEEGKSTRTEEVYEVAKGVILITPEKDIVFRCK